MELVRRNDRGDGMRRGQFHSLVDVGCPAIECTAKDARETEHVVDLIRIVRSSCSHNCDMLTRFLGHDLRCGVRKREDYGVAIHLPDRIETDRSRTRQTEEKVGAFYYVGELAAHLLRVCMLCVPLLGRIHVLLP